MTNFEIAIQQFEKVLDTTSTNHSDRAHRFQSHGIGYQDQYDKIGTITDHEIAIQQYQKTFDHSSSLISHWLIPGRLLFLLYAATENWSQAYQTAFKTVFFVLQFTSHSFETSNKQRLLTNLVDLVFDASVIILNASKSSFDAVQIFEFDRELIIESLNKIRADIFNFQQKHFQIANEYIIFQNQLNASSISIERHFNQHHNVGQKLKWMIQQIQWLFDFDQFLLAPFVKELKIIVKYNSIIIINVNKYRCDALIIEKIQIEILQLFHFHVNDIQACTIEFLTKLEILKWLWKIIIQSVSNTLKFIQTSLNDFWFHIWWIFTDFLAKFFIHAAKYYFEDSSNNVFDRAISFYSFFVKTIIHGRRHHFQVTRISWWKKIILVAMQKTSNQKNLQLILMQNLILNSSTSVIDECRNKLNMMN